MARPCYQHDDRAMMAYCAGCARSCCPDCVLEISGDYYCERCRDQLARDVHQKSVLPEAWWAVLMALVATVFGFKLVGLLLGPYAISRAWKAQQILADAYWLRGIWHVRAAYVLGGFATAIGAVTLMQ